MKYGSASKSMRMDRSAFSITARASFSIELARLASRLDAHLFPISIQACLDHIATLDRFAFKNHPIHASVYPQNDGAYAARLAALLPLILARRERMALNQATPIATASKPHHARL